MPDFDQFSVWLVPFPFTDQNASKRRPAVVVSSAPSFNTPTGHSVMAMITSEGHRPWPLDVALTDLKSAGLPSPSLVRMKLFTLDHRVVIRRLGSLSDKDQKALSQVLGKLFGV